MDKKEFIEKWKWQKVSGGGSASFDFSEALEKDLDELLEVEFGELSKKEMQKTNLGENDVLYEKINEKASYMGEYLNHPDTLCVGKGAYNVLLRENEEKQFMRGDGLCRIRITSLNLDCQIILLKNVDPNYWEFSYDAIRRYGNLKMAEDGTRFGMKLGSGNDFSIDERKIKDTAESKEYLENI